MTLRAGELCAGYGGLALAVEKVFGAETAWVSEFEEAPSKILAHHWPDVPNHGDMTAIDWAAIEQVDIISGGTPCQDVSAAGRRLGMTEGTRSNLFINMCEAIAVQKPKYVVWENVRGAYSAKADSDLELCTGCVGDGVGQPVLRALGRVLGNLSDLGYDCQWRGLRAADVGAPHGRFRVFVLGRRRDAGHAHVPDVEGRWSAGWTDTDPEQGAGPDRGSGDGPHPRLRDARGRFVANPARWASDTGRLSAPGEEEIRWSHGGFGGRGGTCSAADAEGFGRREGRPEPAGVQGGPDLTVSSGSTSSNPVRLCGERRGINGDLVGAPGTGQADGEQRERDGNALDDSVPVDWGTYEPAIRRWETVLGRRAPRPTEPTGRNNGKRLSPRFTEWMMGIPDGWVTDPVIGISRNEQLKACGNGVVPQQAMAALWDMLAAFNSQEVAS